MSVSDLEKAVFRTLAYFAYFKLPLTMREVYIWLLAPGQAYSFQEVNECIKKSEWLKTRTDRCGVYISLEDCATWVRGRERKYRDAERKHRKAHIAAKLMMRVPGVAGIAICNSLAWNATHKEGDIDFFIVTTPGKIWSTRFLLNTPLKLFKLRPGETSRDPICLSFFTDENTLDFSALREDEEDWYLAYWTASLKWIGGSQALAEKFWVQNSWAKNILPHAEPGRVGRSMSVPKEMRIPVILPEALAKKIQENMFSTKIKKMKNTSTHVIVNDRMLKFHDDDRRAAIAAFVRLHMQREGI